MIDGPGPPGTSRPTGRPTTRAPRIRWALIRRSVIPVTGARGTQRILLLRVALGGEVSGSPKRMPAMRPPAATACGIRGRGELKPARSQAGSTPRWTWDTQGRPAGAVEVGPAAMAGTASAAA